MAYPKKRKHGEYLNDINGGADTNSRFGVAETLSRIRLPDSSQLPMASPSVEQGGKNANEGQKVERKSKNKKKRRAGDERTKYPTLTYADGKMQTSIRIADLQGLVLYCFADGVAPQWISMSHSGHVRKVVVLMVPGLEMEMFNQEILFDAASTGDGDTGGKSDIKSSDAQIEIDEKRKDSGFERWKNGLPADSDHYDPKLLSSESLPDLLKPMADMFPHIWPVKAPGDATYHRIHSPLQAMLLTPLPKSREDKNVKSPKPPREEKNWVSKRIPITTLLSTAGDMEDNEFTLHPAWFTSVRDQEAEQERRKKARKSVGDGWLDTRVEKLSDGDVPENDVEKGSMTAGRDVYALDCEMVLVEGDSLVMNNLELARISLVGWGGTVVMDELVKPERKIVDYVTQFSGITKEMLDPITTTLRDVQMRLLEILHPRSILIGHSLNSDLDALKLTHPFIVDTAIIYPHARGPPLKNGLKFLAQRFLRKEIQKGQNGHDSIEDARTTLDLVKLKCERGENWGTSEASSESIFKRLSRATNGGNSRNGRTGAMVDWGTPERGFGAHATVGLGCNSDDEIVTGVNRAVNGDPDGAVVPGGGVSFTWARLRELEALRGWCNLNRNDPSTSIDHLHTTGDTSSDASPKTLDVAVAKTVAHVKSIYDSLPPCSLFIVYSGTGDPREIGRLQNLQKQFKKEFATKKWDELSVRWTDTEEQALKRACEKARRGCGFMTIK